MTKGWSKVEWTSCGQDGDRHRGAVRSDSAEAGDIGEQAGGSEMAAAFALRVFFKDELRDEVLHVTSKGWPGGTVDALA